MSMAFKKLYNYRCVDNNIVVFSVTDRIYRDCFGNTGYNLFIVTHFDDDIVDSVENYTLCDEIWFEFHQVAPIYNDRDSDNNLRIRPRVRVGRCARNKFWLFITNFLDCFAEINNDFDFNHRAQYNSAKRLKIYRKIK